MSGDESVSTMLGIMSTSQIFAEEIAVRAYGSHAWADSYAGTYRLMKRYAGTTAAPLRSFEEILPERWRPKPQFIDDLCRHVRYRRLFFFRAMGRRLGL